MHGSRLCCWPKHRVHWPLQQFCNILLSKAKKRFPRSCGQALINFSMLGSIVSRLELSRLR